MNVYYVSTYNILTKEYFLYTKQKEFELIEFDRHEITSKGFSYFELEELNKEIDPVKNLLKEHIELHIYKVQFKIEFSLYDKIQGTKDEDTSK